VGFLENDVNKKECSTCVTLPLSVMNFMLYFLLLFSGSISKPSSRRYCTGSMGLLGGDGCRAEVLHGGGARDGGGLVAVLLLLMLRVPCSCYDHPVP
jgi:hypothetical protein